MGKVSVARNLAVRQSQTGYEDFLTGAEVRRHSAIAWIASFRLADAGNYWLRNKVVSLIIKVHSNRSATSF